MKENTREKFLVTAKRMFAARGFYGTSIANISEEMGMTKQALLHHFGSKEKLYAEIMQEIGDRSMSVLATAQAQNTNAESKFKTALLDLYDMEAKYPEDTQIMFRELLDVERRASDIHNWYLKPFLEALVSMLKQIKTPEKLSHNQALAAVYPILGSINYLIASKFVLQQMYGPSTYKHMQSHYQAQLSDQLDSLIITLGNHAR
jgi:AcrR family transcriptional regulator